MARITATNLIKRYGAYRAVHGINQFDRRDKPNRNADSITREVFTGGQCSAVNAVNTARCRCDRLPAANVNSCCFDGCDQIGVALRRTSRFNKSQDFNAAAVRQQRRLQRQIVRTKYQHPPPSKGIITG